MKKPSQLLDFEAWEIAKFDISETEIRKVLGEPHYVETRHMRAFMDIHYLYQESNVALCVLTNN